MQRRNLTHVCWQWVACCHGEWVRQPPSRGGSALATLMPSKTLQRNINVQNLHSLTTKMGKSWVVFCNGYSSQQDTPVLGRTPISVILLQDNTPVINKGDWGVHQDRDKEVIWRLLAAWHTNFWCKETAAAQWLLLFLVPLQPSTFQLQPATTTTTPHQAARRRKERTIISKSTIRLQQIRPWSWSLVFMCKWNTEIKQ